MNFISLTEVSAVGVPAASPAFVAPATPVPVNMVSNQYNSLAKSGQGLIDDNRGQAFAALTNGILDRNTALGLDGYDTFGNFPNTLSDFVGLQYGALYRFDTLTVELGQQFGDGGDWEDTDLHPQEPRRHRQDASRNRSDELAGSYGRGRDDRPRVRTDCDQWRRGHDPL